MPQEVCKQWHLIKPKPNSLVLKFIYKLVNESVKLLNRGYFSASGSKVTGKAQ